MNKSEAEHNRHATRSLVGRRKFLAGLAAAGAGLVGTHVEAQTAAVTRPSGVAPVAGRKTVSMGAAEWLTQLTWEKIPQELVTNTKLRILDLLGVMLATTRWDEVTKARRAMTEYDQSKGYKIIGLPGETSLPSASFVNGVLAALLEFDDTHTEAGIHVTAPNVSVAFPAATALGRSGKDLIVAVLGASELTCRLGLMGPRVADLNIHPTGLFGTFGSVYTLSKLRRLSFGQTVSAIGIAGSMAAGGRAAWDEGTDAKTMQVGIAAASGVRAVSLAAQGITGPAAIFESPDGFFRAHVQDPKVAFTFSRLTDNLGKDWQTLNIASKAYPTGYVSHPFMEAAIILRANNKFNTDDIVGITGFGGRNMSGLDLEERGNKLRPKTAWHARVSTFHQIAEALVIGKIDKNAFSDANRRNLRINALADKVFLKADPKFNDRTRSGGTLELKFRDGRTLSHTVADMRGTRRNPIRESDYIAKFRANAAGVISPVLTEKTISGILKLDQSNNVSEVLSPLSNV